MKSKTERRKGQGRLVILHFFWFHDFILSVLFAETNYLMFDFKCVLLRFTDAFSDNLLFLQIFISLKRMLIEGSNHSFIRGGDHKFKENVDNC